MYTWIMENMGTLAVGAFVAVAVIAVIIRMVKNKKKAKVPADVREAAAESVPDAACQETAAQRRKQIRTPASGSSISESIQLIKYPPEDYRFEISQNR